MKNGKETGALFGSTERRSHKNALFEPETPAQITQNTKVSNAVLICDARNLIRSTLTFSTRAGFRPVRRDAARGASRGHAPPRVSKKKISKLATLSSRIHSRERLEATGPVQLCKSSEAVCLQPEIQMWKAIRSARHFHTRFAV